MRRLYILLLLLAGCSKNEHPVEELPFTNINVNTLSVDDLRLRVMINEEVWTDSLLAPNGSRTTLGVHYTDPKHRFRLYDAFTNRLYLDTLVEYQPGYTNTITFQQLLTGSGFVWVGPPVNEPLPPAGYSKVSLRYTLPSLPNEVKVVLENGTTFTPVDSFELRKNEYSKYFKLVYGVNVKTRIGFYSATGRTLLATIGTSELGGLRIPFNIYLIRKQYNAAPGQPIEMISEKLY